MDVHATAEDFSRWEEKAKKMTLAELHYAIKDAGEASRKGTSKANYYRDEMLTYQAELNRRRKSPTIFMGRAVK